jgi:hypothetical protein
MERKRVAGRFVREGLDGTEGKVAVGAPRPKYCRTFTRARVAEALPEIVDRFTEEAKKGSIAHVKVLMKIGGLDTGEVVPKGTKRKGPSLIGLVKQSLAEDKAERAKTEAVAEGGGAEGQLAD